MRTRTVALAITAVIVQALGSVTPARAADPVTVPFSFTGTEQSWVVPDGVTSIHAVLVGARGAGFGPGSVGGFGHRAEADVTVAPGQTIYVEVGGPGSAGGLTAGGSGGFNGGAAGGNGGILGNGSGGGGGGGTDLRTISRITAGTLESRLVVAGGGGGGGAGSNGGAGGNAGDSGGNAIGGGTTGGAPGFDGVFGCGGCGGNTGGEAGVMGLGGRGGDDPSIGAGDSGAGGGGGGGGYQGGGGGGGGPSSGGGGGGGSSFADGWSLDNPNVTVDGTGIPSASITYTPDAGGGGGSGTGTVSAVVTMAESTLCLELSTTSIDFGTRGFGEVRAVASPSFDVTNCSGIAEAVLARGTDAVGSGTSAWSLVDTGTCAEGTLGTDAYRLTLGFPNAPGAFIPLSTENSESILNLGPGDVVIEEALLDTPCPGSSGAGEVMSMQIIFVAVEETVP